MTPPTHTQPGQRTSSRSNRPVSVGLRDRLGDNLRALRRARGLTQIELAALCHCNHRLISNLENALRNATLEMLATALNCCESDLLRRGMLPAQGPPPPRAPGPADDTSLDAPSELE
jgi:transcriptional regulator with XRE-family HTH domain